VLSVAEHAGWAHVVGVAASGTAPAVIARRRVTLIDPGLPKMPYEHESVGMKEADADALIARARRSIAARTALALQRLVTELSPVHAAVALTIRTPPFPELPGTVRAVRKSYRLQCAADGMLYQLAFCDAARQLGLDVQLYRRGDEAAWAAQQLRVTPGDIEEFVTGPGRPAGPPWAQEHRRAFAAGIAALARHTRKPLVIPSCPRRRTPASQDATPEAAAGFRRRRVPGRERTP
jgi:hypothetical protein